MNKIKTFYLIISLFVSNFFPSHLNNFNFITNEFNTKELKNFFLQRIKEINNRNIYTREPQISLYYFKCSNDDLNRVTLNTCGNLLKNWILPFLNFDINGKTIFDIITTPDGLKNNISMISDKFPRIETLYLEHSKRYIPIDEGQELIIYDPEIDLQIILSEGKIMNWDPHFGKADKRCYISLILEDEHALDNKIVEIAYADHLIAHHSNFYLFFGPETVKSFCWQEESQSPYWEEKT